MGRELLVIVPAHNEEKAVGDVVRRVRESLPQADIVVVDDGSTDRTAAEAGAAGALVLPLPSNVGIGGAMQTGYIFARDRGYSVAVQVDGDGQHEPKEIGRLLEPLREGRTDVVIGSRFLERNPYNASRARRLGTLFFAKVISAIVGQRVTDTTSGFRAVNRKVIELFAADYPTDYPEPEAVVLLRRAGFRMTEVPVNMNPRLAGVSSITPFLSLYYMLKVLLAILVDLLREAPALKGG